MFRPAFGFASGLEAGTEEEEEEEEEEKASAVDFLLYFAKQAFALILELSQPSPLRSLHYELIIHVGIRRNACEFKAPEFNSKKQFAIKNAGTIAR